MPSFLVDIYFTLTGIVSRGKIKTHLIDDDETDNETHQKHNYLLK